jgi:hypothetical protein
MHMCMQVRLPLQTRKLPPPAVPQATNSITSANSQGSRPPGAATAAACFKLTPPQQEQPRQAYLCFKLPQQLQSLIYNCIAFVPQVG